MKPRCDCGGILKRTVFKEYDFSPFAGVPSTLRNVRGWLCEVCGLPTMDGTVINQTLRTMEFEIAKQPERLSHEHARFLRKRMRLTQQALAERMSVARETVADWERGASTISPQHDFILRNMAMAHLLETGKVSKEDLLNTMTDTRTSVPRKAHLPILIGKVA